MDIKLLTHWQRAKLFEKVLYDAGLYCCDIKPVGYNYHFALSSNGFTDYHRYKFSIEKIDEILTHRSEEEDT